MKKPKLSEIRARDQSAPGGARFDVPYLLDLAKRLGELAEKLMKATKVEEMGMGRSTFHISDSDLKECCEKAHALLKELEL